MTAAHYIGVIGASDATPAEREIARTVGGGLASAGAIVLCGGRGGVMEAVCEGAKRGGGLTVGVLPGSDRAEANPHVDVALASGLGELRNGLIVRFSDALIAVGGAWGTLSEIAFAMRIGRPVVVLASWNAALAEAQERALPGAGAEQVAEGVGALRHAEDPEAAVELALRLARGA
jgi:uncharacterized protein (TIGR00725 family)